MNRASSLFTLLLLPLLYEHLMDGDAEEMAKLSPLGLRDM